MSLNDNVSHPYPVSSVLYLPAQSKKSGLQVSFSLNKEVCEEVRKKKKKKMLSFWIGLLNICESSTHKAVLLCLIPSSK